MSSTGGFQAPDDTFISVPKRDDDERDLLPDELAPEAHEPAQTFYEQGKHAGSVPGGSTKVGWTLRDSKGRVRAAFSFLINPQGLTRDHGSRSQLQATKSHFYVDHFGPEANTIALRQLVASGKVYSGGFFTAREDIQRFLKTIYLPATAAVDPKNKLRVFFHDHHFERGFEEHVFFPSRSLTIERSVELHNVWRFELQMVSLEKYPYDEITVEGADPRTRQGRRYIVRAGDTLDRIVARLAGKGASAAKRRRVRDQLLELNPQLRKKRLLAVPHGPGGHPIYGKPMKVYPGELIRLPA